MRYFRVEQGRLLKSMCNRTYKVDINEMINRYEEINQRESEMIPKLGEAIVVVHPDGTYNWISTNWDSSD
jgi:hypothetical protein